MKIEDIESLVGLQLGIREVSADDRLLEDLGAESTDLVNLLATVEDRYGVVIDEEEIADLCTVRDLYQRVRSASR